MNPSDMLLRERRLLSVVAAIFAAVWFLVCGFPAFAAETVAAAAPDIHQPLIPGPVAVSHSHAVRMGHDHPVRSAGSRGRVCIRRKVAGRI